MTTAVSRTARAYRYVQAKDELLILMADAVYGTPPEPAVHAALPAGGHDEEGGSDDEFVFGLDRVLDGVQRLIEARGAAPAEREPEA
ncbi:hypothetical protein [Streptomyces sp. NPDC003863]